jgi:hypothetical protein
MANTSTLRFFPPFFLVVALLLACATPQTPPAPTGATSPAPAPEAAGPAAPADWQPVFWDNAMREAQQAREHGDRATAERACARGIPYVQAQVIKVLYGYSEVLDRQNYGSGLNVRSKVQKLEQARDQQAMVRKSGNTYLGFDPAAELKSYADLLSSVKRNNDALLVEALSAAYTYTQDANLRRSQLQQQGKDPLGEC